MYLECELSYVYFCDVLSDNYIDRGNKMHIIYILGFLLQEMGSRDINWTKICLNLPYTYLSSLI